MRQKRQNSLIRIRFREVERIILLRVIDNKWMDHIDDMDQLREGIGLTGIWTERSGCGVQDSPDLICSMQMIDSNHSEETVISAVTSYQDRAESRA